MADSDREANRFSARAARYARVGANMGGVAARMAGARLFDRDGAGCLQRGGAGAGARRPERADHEGGAAARHHPGSRSRRNTPPNCRSCRARRRPWARLSSSGACRRNSGRDWRSRFGSFDLNPAAAASLGQVHRATTKDGEALACKLQYPGHAIGRGGGSAAARIRLLAPSPHGPRHRHPRDRQGDRRAGARGARLRARGQARGALCPCACAMWTRSGCRVSISSCRRSACCRSNGSRARRSCNFTEARRRDPQPAGGRHVQGVVASLQPCGGHPRRSASRQLHGVLGRRRAAGHQPARLRLRPHLPSALRRRRGRSLSRPADRRPRPGRPCLRDLGLQEPLDRADRHPQHLGPLHLRARCSTTGSAPWRTA